MKKQNSEQGLRFSDHPHHTFADILDVFTKEASFSAEFAF